MSRYIKFAPLLVLGFLVVVFAVALLRPSPVENDPFTGRVLPDLPLTPFANAPGFDPTNLEGPYLLNVWASWCTPCRIEHPYLMTLAEQGVPIYGIVYKDDPNDAALFLTQLGDPFTALMADEQGRAGIEIGLLGAPETLLVDQEGRIRARWRGAITDIVWQQSFAPIWARAGGAPIDWTIESEEAVSS